MAKRRTKKDRIKTSLKRQGRQIKKKVTLSEAQLVDLLHFDIKLITQDLKKTLTATAVVMLILVALYFKL